MFPAWVSAAFILANSVSGLAGRFTEGQTIPSVSWPWLVAAGIGGLLGSHFGAKKLSTGTLRRLLGVALLIAAWKLVYESVK